MCTEGRRRESRSVCLTEPIKIIHKNLPGNSSPTNLECMPRGQWQKLMFVQRQGRKYMSPFTILNVQSAVKCESGICVPSRKLVYFGISELILISHITFMHHVFYSSLCTFMYHVLCFLLCTFTLQFPCFSLCLLLTALESKHC